VGTSKTVPEFSGKLTGAAGLLEKQGKRVVGAGALAAKKIILAEAAAAGVSPSSKIAGKKWGVRYDVKGGTDPVALVRFRGPFHLVDNPTEPHKIGPKTKGRRKKRKAVSFGGMARASVKHPGTKGKRTFPKAVKKAEVVVPRIMASSMIGNLRKIFV
jgi:hypothetical protein